ncbi:hypothetical protein K501DRAFT_269326 [Backusella circina FSU 941]|nr:hypothetical protein K501DRAFT_269326 [Backusella circina FSU 941]
MASGRTYPDLRILSIMNEHVGDQTFQYIKRAIPNLEVLYWMMGYNHTDMDLTRWDFYKCELLISSKKETENCSVTIQGATKELYIGLKRKLCYQILYLTFYLVCGFKTEKHEDEIAVVL